MPTPALTGVPTRLPPRRPVAGGENRAKEVFQTSSSPRRPPGNATIARRRRRENVLLVWRHWNMTRSTEYSVRSTQHLISLRQRRERRSVAPDRCRACTPRAGRTNFGNRQSPAPFVRRISVSRKAERGSMPRRRARRTATPSVSRPEFPRVQFAPGRLADLPR